MNILTHHAVARAQERGFSESVIQFVARRGDVRKPAKLGRRAIFVSEHLVDVLAASGFDADFLAQAKKCCVIMAGKSIVTCHDGSQMSRSFN